MDRLSQLRGGEAGGSRDSTLDTTSPPSEAFMTANESSSKYYSLSEVDSTFDISSMKDDISSIKDVSVANATTDSEGTMTNADELISNLSPIGKKSDILDSYKINTQIEAANILSGGVAIFDDNDNSYDGHELVIDDNVEIDDKSNSELKQSDTLQSIPDDNILDSSLISEDADIASKDTEVVLQIDGKNVDAIDIGNGLYLYRKEGQEELAAVQIVDDDQQQPSFKFLKVRENAEGNLEVYEEIEIEVPKEVPAKDGKIADKNTPSHVPIKDINRVISDSVCNKVADRKIKAPRKEPTTTNIAVELEDLEASADNKSEVNLNGKMMKFSESRKSPVIGSFKPMTYHSTPNKEGIPLTKTMVDQQLHPNRHSHSDLSNVKKTIEVHTDSSKQKPTETPIKCKEIDDNKFDEISSTEKEIIIDEPNDKNVILVDEQDSEIIDVKGSADSTNKPDEKTLEDDKSSKTISDQKNNVSMEQDNAVDSTEKEIIQEKTDDVSNVDNENKDGDLIVEDELKIDETGTTKIVEAVTIEKLKVEEKDEKNVEKNPTENIKEKQEIKKIEKESEVTNIDENIKEKQEIKIIEKESEITNINEKVVIDNTEANEIVIEEDDQAKDIEVIELTKTDSVPIADMKISKDEPMEVANETELIIEETPITVQSKPTEANVQIEHEIKQVEDVNDKKGEVNIGTDEPILIEDDDVSIVEVVVESKEDKEITALTDNTNKNKSDTPIAETPKQVDKIAGVNIDNSKSKEIISENKYVLKKDKDETDFSTEAVNETLLKSETVKPLIVEQKVKKEVNAVSYNIQKEFQSNFLNPKLLVQNNPNKNVISSPVDILNKKIEPKLLQLETKDVLIKSAISPPKQTSSRVADNIQNDKLTETVEIKSAAPKEEPVKHVPANISPLLEQRQKSIIAPKAIPEKLTLQIPHNVTNINKIVGHKVEGKTIDVFAKTEPGRGIQATQVPPIAPPMQIYSSNPIPVTQAVTKDKVIIDRVLEQQKNIFLIPVKNVAVDKRPAFEIKTPFIKQKDDEKLPYPTTIKIPSKNTAFEKGRGVMNIEITKVPKFETAKTNTAAKQNVSSTSSKITSQTLMNKVEPKDKKEISKVAEPKPINNNDGVPFGQWTDVNRQEFVNKFKTKTSVTSSNTNQLKNSNDLNRRDVLKKIDSQRQTSNALSKSQEASKLNMKAENQAFTNKPNILSKEPQESKIPQKTDTVDIKAKSIGSKNLTKTEIILKTQNEPSHSTTATGTAKKEVCSTQGNVQNLIDKTIEGMIHRNVSAPKTQDEPKQNTTKDPSNQKPTKPQKSFQPIQPACDAKFDEIEMKMNELHGIPFIERPPHELPQIPKADIKSYSKVEKEKPAIPIKTKIPNLLPFPNKVQQKVTKESVIEVDSEDEIIEHEPITGDIDLNKKHQVVKPPTNEKLPTNINPQIQQEKSTSDAAKKEAIITEKDFDKFARRNSITYENRLTVNFDGKEPHNVVQTVVEKDTNPKNYSKNDVGRADPKAKVPYKYQSVRPSPQISKLKPTNKLEAASDDNSDRNQSKVQKAYKALTEKRQIASDYSITIIEDKPVKVLFVENTDTYAPSTQLNVQGQDLSPAKRPIPEPDVPVSTGDSLDSDMLDAADDGRSQDDVRSKSTKHQRKQVLTPVEEPELELIEPRDLGIEVSPKKKRRTDDDKSTPNLKYPMRKKLYLIGSSAVAEDKVTNPIEIMKNPLKDTINLNDNGVAQKNPVSALDSLVKAAELIETQTENRNASIISNPDSQPNTPVKRGRGRPRKYPLTPDGTVDKSKVISPSPQKKPRLIDAKAPKRDTISDDDSDSEGAIIKENWTMGKINENIVCPICNKLFRTENVVFKHVKHCTGPSPSRSDSDKRSPRSMRISQDSDSKSRESKSDDMDIDDDKPLIMSKLTPKKRKSKDSSSKSDEKDEIIVIEDTPIKENPKKLEERKHESRKSRTKLPHKSNDLVCEFCGKTFRQLSYLVSHKLQHKKPEKAEPKKFEKDAPIANKPVYSCEVCKKEFRKLHHLVQHRIIHNPSSAPARSLRKSSSEQSSESKFDREPSTSKQSDDPSAGFRCEPCDKSFRKLHHLVEHRETHDGINRQKITTALPSKEEKPVEKPVSVHQCDICKKTFKKVQLLKEHKELHVETSSEKSDDKSVKSSLSTRDIIHECSLCYMVFPNEHSLNKHTVFCQRKKRQSKQLKPATDGTEEGEEAIESPTPEEKNENVDSPIILDESNKDEKNHDVVEKMEAPKDAEKDKVKAAVVKEKSVEPIKDVEKEKVPQKVEEKAPELQVTPAKRDFQETDTSAKEIKPEVTEKIKKVEQKEPVKIQETPKKKVAVKDKSASATKRLKTTSPPTKDTEDIKPVPIDSSDDDEVRYMLNPNFKPEDVTEEKVFMKVRAKKRSSLQIERPNSKDLVKRRTSLQHPPKIPRLKPKALEPSTTTVKKEVKALKLEAVPSTDSDDSETTKYSFPPTIPDKQTKPAPDRTPKDSERKSQKKSLADKRKSLIGIAKRKSLGKAVIAKHKVTPLKPVKKRTLDAEHRCDCGQLFSSAALLSRHTTLAHTPPRIRRRRSPPPDDKPVAKPPSRKSTAAEKPKQSPASRKSSARSDSTSNSKPSRSEVKAKSPNVVKKAKPEKSEEKSSVKPRRTGAHRGVPVPEKMKKVMQKNK